MNIGCLPAQSRNVDEGYAGISITVCVLDI